jgi:glutamate-1-semialdehyde 2,1-aminomutase
MVSQHPPRSKAQADLVARAKAVFPGGTTNSIVQPEGREILVDHGVGAYLYDVDGRKYLDFAMGGGPLILGHAHPRIVAAITRTASKGTHHFGLTARAVELAERICKYLPSAEMVRFSSTGSEATLHALRLARVATGRSAFIKFDGAYHGHHDLAAWSYEGSVTRYPKGTPGSGGIQNGTEKDVYVLPFNDIGAFKAAMNAKGSEFAAVICEPLQRALAPKPGFLEALREECDRHGTVLIFDEVVTGFRFAPGSAQQRYGVTPDLTTLGKALSAGLPMSAIAGKRNYMKHFDPALENTDPDHFSFHCGTLNAFLLAVECAHVTLDAVMDEGGLHQLDELGEMMRDGLRKVFEDEDVPAYIAGDSAIFHPYLSERPVENNRDVAASNWDMSNAFHVKLWDVGVYKTFTKGYITLAHDSSHIEDFLERSRWALHAVKQS